MAKSGFSIIISRRVLNKYFKDFFKSFTSDMDICLVLSDKSDDLVSDDNLDYDIISDTNTDYRVVSDRSYYNDYPDIRLFADFNSILEEDFSPDTICFISENDLDLVKNTSIENNNLIVIPGNLENKEFINWKISHMRELIGIFKNNSYFIENLLVYNIYEIIELDYSIFEKSRYLEIISSIINILKSVSKDTILNSNFLNNDMKSFLIFIKNNQEYTLDIRDKTVLLYTGDYLIDDLAFNNIKIDIIDLKDGFLSIDAYIKSNFYLESIRFEAILDSGNSKEKFNSNLLEYPSTDRRTFKYLGISWVFYYNFNIQIPIDYNKTYKIDLKTIFTESDNQITINNNISFRKHGNISYYTNYTYLDSKIIEFKNNSFYLYDYSSSKVLSLEFKSLLRILKSSKPFWYKAIFYRILYLILKPFYKNKKIFLFEDRSHQADDNGEILFKYAVTQDDNIDKYFIIDKNTSDYKRLSKDYKNIIPFKSFKHKILYLFADKHFSSHVDRVYLDPFDSESPELYNSLATFRRYFLQHGVIQSDLSHWIRKYYHNLDLFLTSSKYERDSIVNGYYNYDSNIVQLLGLPRYDYLENKEGRKEILFMPTWRKYLKTKEDFLQSDYYKRLNRFFNNSKLKEELLEYGYKIVFKPHFNILEYLDFLDIDEDYVRLAVDESYRDLFNNSNLLITDYSSVFFDFAYLKKPIIYYQEADEYHFNKGYFDYETMGFGDIIKDEDELVDLIISYMENDCKMSDKYIMRVEDFFKYTDKNNSKRVYNWSLNEGKD